MRNGLRFGLLVACIIALVMVLISVKKNKLNIKYSIAWILWSLLCLGMAIFPESFYALTELLGIEIPVNAVFLIMIALLYALTFYAYVMVSKHNSEIIQLTYEISVLKKELDSKKKKK